MVWPRDRLWISAGGGEREVKDPLDLGCAAAWGLGEGALRGFGQPAGMRVPAQAPLSVQVNPMPWWVGGSPLHPTRAWLEQGALNVTLPLSVCLSVFPFTATLCSVRPPAPLQPGKTGPALPLTCVRVCAWGGLPRLASRLHRCFLSPPPPPPPQRAGAPSAAGWERLGGLQGVASARWGGGLSGSRLRGTGAEGLPAGGSTGKILCGAFGQDGGSGGQGGGLGLPSAGGGGRRRRLRGEAPLWEGTPGSARGGLGLPLASEGWSEGAWLGQVWGGGAPGLAQGETCPSLC